MKSGRFSEEQIVGIFEAARRAKGGRPGARGGRQRSDDLCLEEQVRGTGGERGAAVAAIGKKRTAG